jgi:hypothetical protein
MKISITVSNKLSQTSFATQWQFYVAASAMMMCDNALLTGIIWISLQVTQSSLLLGGVLCMAVAIPFVLERLFTRRPFRASLGRLAIMRLVIFSVAVALVQMGAARSPVGFLFVALATGMIDYFTMNALEAENTKFVVTGYISSEAASRRMQTAIQTGSFLGALLGGTLLGLMPNEMFVSILGTMAGLASLLLPSTHRRLMNEGNDKELVLSPHASAECTGVYGRRLSLQMIVPQLFCLGFIGFHIAAFNCMVPLVYERIHGWNAAMFGAAGGLAGVGAFLASLLPIVCADIVMYAGAIIVADALLVLSPYPMLSALSALVLGFLVNYVRIFMRARLIEAAHTDREAELIASHSTFYFLCFQAAAPIVLTTLVSAPALGNSFAPVMMIISGCLLCGATLTARSSRFIYQSRP